jgi:hypothetical protein
MRISLVESRTNGFKKWSDAQHPTARALSGDDQEIRGRQRMLTRADEDIGSAPNEGSSN